MIPRRASREGRKNTSRPVLGEIGRDTGDSLRYQEADRWLDYDALSSQALDGGAATLVAMTWATRLGSLAGIVPALLPMSRHAYWWPKALLYSSEVRMSTGFSSTLPSSLISSSEIGVLEQLLWARPLVVHSFTHRSALRRERQTKDVT